MSTSSILYEDVLPTGRHWSLVMRRGTALRLVDVKGGANVGMLFYNPQLMLERINIPDTLKCQHTFRLGLGHCIYSDMGRIFCSIVEDTAGWHDAVGGTCQKDLVAEKWGRRDFQTARNEYLGNGRDAFLIELAKYGLGKRDLAANLNLFSRMTVDDAGVFQFVNEEATAGREVCLRFEMDTLVIMHTCPHPMNAAQQYPDAPVKVVIEQAAPMSDDDICLNSRPENRRGFQNNALYCGVPFQAPVTEGVCCHDH